jgi:oxalate decarboxylase/phosphoglucose isomerase-like protein (cupin superfamily)
MVMMDLVDDSFSSVYDDYSEKKWAAYYLKNGNWDKNPHYDSHTPLFEKTDKLNFSQNIYDEFVQFPEKFSFLK